MFSFSAENETRPLDSPMLLSTDAAIFSSFSSSSSPVLFFVPPVRITMPVAVARPILSGGSNRLPVRTRAKPRDQRQLVIFQQIHAHAIGQREALDVRNLDFPQRREFQVLVGRRRGTARLLSRAQLLRRRGASGGHERSGEPKA